jgi:hypothetical protein
VVGSEGGERVGVEREKKIRKEGEGGGGEIMGGGEGRRQGEWKGEDRKRIR